MTWLALRIDKFIHLRRWAWWIPAPIHCWIDDRLEPYVMRQWWQEGDEA